MLLPAQMVLPSGPFGLVKRLVGSASFRISGLASLALLGAWVAQSSGAVQDFDLHKFGEVRCTSSVERRRGWKAGSAGTDEAERMRCRLFFLCVSSKRGYGLYVSRSYHGCL